MVVPVVDPVGVPAALVPESPLVSSLQPEPRENGSAAALVRRTQRKKVAM
jgi:hypothetical protein